MIYRQKNKEGKGKSKNENKIYHNDHFNSCDCIVILAGFN